MKYCRSKVYGISVTDWRRNFWDVASQTESCKKFEKWNNFRRGLRLLQQPTCLFWKIKSGLNLLGYLQSFHRSFFCVNREIFFNPFSVIFKSCSNKRFLLLKSVLYWVVFTNHFPRAKYIVRGSCFVFGFKQSNLDYLFKNIFCL